MRQRLVESARQAFERDGYEAVSFRELAKAAGVSTGAFYSAFPSKSALFEAAMDHPAPDAAAFANRVMDFCSAGIPTATDLNELAAEAAIMRAHLIGNGV